MPVQMYVSIAALVVGVGYLFWLAAAGEGRVVRAVRSNLQRDLPSVAVGSDARRGRRNPFGRRIIGSRAVGLLETLSAKAGRPEKWPVDRIIGAKLIGALVGLGFGVIFFVRAGTTQSLALALFLVAFLFFLPDLLLWNAGIKRRQAIQLELPDTLDQMSIAVEAGWGFDAAMVRVARNGKGILAQELIRTLQDIQVGQPRRLAYETLADRVPVPELRRFIRATIQAEEYGIPLADVLHTQAREMRVARRQRAERTAMEIPVKVSFPLVLTLLPALMIVILGPAVLSIMEAFS